MSRALLVGLEVCCLLMGACVFSCLAASAGQEAKATEQDYMLYCMGCHQRGGEGLSGHVPSLKGLEFFLDLSGGREYLVRVPGVANTSLPDDRLARLLNWTLAEFAAPSWDSSAFQPYTASEVGPLRSRPFLNAIAARERLLNNGPTGSNGEPPARENIVCLQPPCRPPPGIPRARSRER